MNRTIHKLSGLRIVSLILYLFIFVSTLAVFYISTKFELYELLSEFIENHEKYELDELIIVAIYLFFVTSIISIVRWFQLENALKAIKELKGIVPICSSCKSVRDDKGYWHNVEKYIGEHTDADFSHSLCPNCAKELYPEMADDLE